MISSIVHVIILLVLLLVLLLTIFFYQLNLLSNSLTITTAIEIRIIFVGLLVLLLYCIGKLYKTIIVQDNIYIVISSALILVSSFTLYCHYSSKF